MEKLRTILKKIRSSFLKTFKKFKNHQVVPFSQGFYHQGIPYAPHNSIHLKQSAFYRVSDRQKLLLTVFLSILIISLVISWQKTFVIIIAFLTFIYFIDLLFNLFLIYRSFSQSPEIKISDKELDSIPENKWPKYSILCPLYREHKILPQFVKAMKRLDYPKYKLEVLLLLEEDDKEIFKKAQNLSLPEYFHIINVPPGLPKTKPKALNFGLKYVHGEFVTIYDAEDIPETKQLKKAVVAFKSHRRRLACVQAKLNFYNPHQNIITRIFTAEYALWFDLVLTGLQSINAPIPLGGTSNHFRTKDLRKIHGWDAFNVTEDCDLGIRLAKHGFSTAIIDSFTYEEANSDLFNWFSQRSRWIKGYIQTYLVHTRNLKTFIKKSGFIHAFTFQLIVGGKVMSVFINPLMWALTIVYFYFRTQFGPLIESFFPAPVFYAGIFSLIFGNFLYMYYYMIGCAKRGQEDIIKYAYLVPVYWLGMSISAWRSVYEIINRPFYWAKTDHGFHIISFRRRKQSKLYVKIVLRPVFLFGSNVIRNFRDLIEAFLPLPKIQKETNGKRILIFNWRDTKHDFAGGAEVYLHELAKRWVALGHKVTLFCGNDGKCPRYEVIDGIEIYRRGGFYSVYFFAFIYYLLHYREEYDIIIDSENGVPFFTPLYVKEKVFLLMYHVHQEVFRKSLYPPLAIVAEFLEEKLMPWVYKRSKFITVSPSTKVEMAKLGINQSEINIVNPGVDLDLLIPGIKSKNPSVLYLGRLKYYKSISIFIESAVEVLKYVPSVRFVIAGDGEEKQKLQKLVKFLKLEKYIKFLGKVTQNTKVRLYQQTWVFVNPSMMEGWGMTVIEANACGAPVVASHVPGLMDSVHNPSSGYLVPYGDSQAFAEKIILLLNNENLRSKMSKQAINWAQNFEWKKSADNSLKILKYQ